MTMSVEHVDLDQLEGDPRNPKGHHDRTIRASLARFGFIDPIVRDDRTGMVVSGHGRTDALRQLRDQGAPAPDGVEVTEDGTWLVPVVTGWSSANDSEAGAALVALNRAVEMGGWDTDALTDLLADLDDYEGVGYSQRDLDDLRVALGDMVDLDELAEEWSPETPSDDVKLTITVRRDTAARWNDHVTGYSSEDLALDALL